MITQTLPLEDINKAFDLMHKANPTVELSTSDKPKPAKSHNGGNQFG
jgi:hypothetical protein